MCMREGSKFVPLELLATLAVAVGSRIRTIGKVCVHDVRKEQLVIRAVDCKAEFTVDCRLIEPFPKDPHVLYQFIGELVRTEEEQGRGRVVLKAVTYRCVNGLNFDLYKRAQSARFPP